MLYTLRKKLDEDKYKWIKDSLFGGVPRRVYHFMCNSFNFRYLIWRKKSDKKTVLIMVDSMAGGGAERVASILASELVSKYRVMTFCFREALNEYPVDSRVERIYFFDSSWNNKKKRKKLVRFVRGLKRKQKVYASISLLYQMNALNAATSEGEKTICCERNNPSKGKHKARFKSTQRIYEKADCVVFQSEQVRGLYSDSIKAHSVILPNPIQVYCERSKQTKHRIVSFGRFAGQKNHALLIRAFKRFREVHPDYTLSIYGEGLLKNDLQRLINELQLENAAFLHDRSMNVHQEIADAEFFVLSSDFEGLSNALLESMYMGMPCISTDCEGSVDVIENGINGILVPRKNEDELVKAMLIMAEDEDLRTRLGEKAKESMKRYDRKVVAEEWINVIENFE